MNQHTNSLPSIIAATCVHLLTAFGAVLGFAALNAAIDGDVRGMWLLLGAAFLVDGIDGPLARKINITQRLPAYDGAVLDLLVDYLTYVLVPALYLYRSDLLPPALAPVLIVAILLASLYTFGNRNMKSQDNYFIGFPALWNVTAFYFFAIGSSPWVNAVVIATLVALTFTNVKMVHPFRVKTWRGMTLFVVLLWSVASIIIVMTHPYTPFEAMWCLGGTSLYFLGISLWRTWGGPSMAL